jgi:two-component system sensor histidine kinase KdpD
MEQDDNPRQASSQEMLAIVAHELRAPLASLIATSEALAEDFESLERPQAQSMAISLYRRSLHMRALVENLLSIACLDEQQLRLQREWIDLNELLAEVVEVVEPLLAQHGQACTIVSTDMLPMLHVDRSKMSQVLVNLLINAGKYGPAHSDIVITATVNRQNRTVRVSVQDHGPGVDATEVDHLFEAYRRHTSGGDRPIDGVGLGLAVVKAIINEHGGRVGAENRSEGGASFWLELPIWKAATNA